MKKLLLLLALIATPAYAYVQVGDPTNLDNVIVCYYVETLEEAMKAFEKEGTAGGTAVLRASIVMGHCARGSGTTEIKTIERRLPGLAIIGVNNDANERVYTFTRDHP
jgi:hypothetical protein